MADLPKGWRLAKYGEVLAETHERRGSQENIPVLSVTKTRGPMLASERFGKRLHSRNLTKYRLAPRGHIVADPMLLWDGSIGQQDVVDLGVVSPDYRVYRLSDEVIPDFMGYVVRSPTVRRFYQSGARGTNVRRNRIARADFLTIPFLIPPLAEQQRITAILSSIDDAVEKTEAVIERLQDLKKALMHELLTRGLPGRHARFKKTEIGEVPEEWKMARLDTVALVQTGIAKGKKADGDAVEVPYLRVANVQDGYVDLSEVKTIEVPRRALRRYSLRAGDVLFTEGGDADKLGRGCVWRGQLNPCLHQNHVFAVRPQKYTLTPQFLSYFGGSPAGKKYFLSCSKQTTNLASINSSQLKALPVPLAPLDEQESIVAALRSVDNRIKHERDAGSELKSMKASLISVLLTGEVRVNSGEAKQ